MDLFVSSDGLLSCGGRLCRAALGRSGVGAKQGEGDGLSPLGRWPLRRVYYRADRLAKPETALPLSALDPLDAWCDVPGDPCYNRAVRLPYPVRDEKLWRDDHLYDVIVVLGYNDDPVIDGMGSAIFMHIARDGYAPTAGCVGLALPDMLAVIRAAQIGDGLVISDQPMALVSAVVSAGG